MATRRALVVGINDYGGAPNNLPSCVNDANAITQLLQTRYDFKEVHVLRDAEATIAKIDDELKWLSKNVQPDDRLVFYFSGHGYTKLANGVMEEFLVAHDGLFDDNRLVATTRELAPGTLTVILDASFSGGTEKFVFDPAGVTPDVEVSQVKSWKPRAEDTARDKELTHEGQHTVAELRRFGCSPIASRSAIAKTLAVAASVSRAAQSTPSVSGATAWLPSVKPGSDEAGQLELNGIVLSACLETETAVASTSKTEGLSAFTYALVRSVERLGALATVADVLSASEMHLKSLGVRQTAMAVEPNAPGELKRRRFITLERVGVPDNLGVLSDPRFWEGVLTAMAPQMQPLRAVSTKEGELMSTMYQPTQGFQGTMGYQPGYNFGQPSVEDVQRIIPTLGPILATVIPAIVPPILNSLLAQQKSFGTGGYGLAGNYQQTSPEDVQKILPMLGPILASVIPAVVPPIINSLVAQQRATMGWGGLAGGAGSLGATPPGGLPFGGSQFGTSQFGGGPFSQFGGGQLGGSQPGNYNPLGWNGQPGQDLTQVVTQSVNDALRRVGVQQPAFAGRF
jgi:caspase domain-containing protein